MDYLNRVFLYAAVWLMLAGQQIQEAVDTPEAAGIPSMLLKGPGLARTVHPDSMPAGGRHRSTGTADDAARSVRLVLRLLP